MPDRRLNPSNGRVAPEALRGLVEADAFVTPVPRRVSIPVVDLCARPSGPRDRQLLWGTLLHVLEERDGWAFVQNPADAYVGYVPMGALGPDDLPNYQVSAPASHLYPAPDFKTKERASLSFGSQVRVIADTGRFSETPQGFIPRTHLRPIASPFADPVTVAQLFFGTPYLWGGNSATGIDCSGLVQIACHACAIPCPADSDLQQAALGTALPDDTAPERGDLMFWKGHVAWVVDADTIIHANAHHMAVAYEPIRNARLRIEAQGDGPVTAHKRLSR
ncbi:C40 family peptidase [Alphaproteobacteria bacterium KMM 3653]|uniref:C40 family peptidase n=1 Tax=Harenicola maris TaxID=2841044 RepID=A0AAP2CPM2_9RHOB|nr:C40 family peptidase [Harenicola maris]